MKVLRFVLRSIGGLWSALMILLMVMSLSLSVAMTMVPAVFATVSGVVGAAASAVGFKRPTVAKLLSDKEKFLSAESQRLNRQVASMADKEKSLIAESDTLERQLASMADKEKMLTSERDKLKRQLASPEVKYRGTNRPVQEAVADTSTRIANRIKVAATRNVGSTFGEAIPFVGVGVIAAAIALDLSDTCQLLKDVRELDAAFNPENPIDPAEVCGLKPPSAEELWESVRSAPSDVWDGVKQAPGWFQDLKPGDLPDWPSVKDSVNGFAEKMGTFLDSTVGALTDGFGSAVQMGAKGGSDLTKWLKGQLEKWRGGEETEGREAP